MIIELIVDLVKRLWREDNKGVILEFEIGEEGEVEPHVHLTEEYFFEVYELASGLEFFPNYVKHAYNDCLLYYLSGDDFSIEELVYFFRNDKIFVAWSAWTAVTHDMRKSGLA